MVYPERFHQLATQWYIKMIFMIDHGYMQALKKFVDSQIDNSCLWVVRVIYSAVCIINSKNLQTAAVSLLYMP